MRTGANGQITQAEAGIAGFSGLNDPVDLTEDPTTGCIYVVELGARQDHPAATHRSKADKFPAAHRRCISTIPPAEDEPVADDHYQ